MSRAAIQAEVTRARPACGAVTGSSLLTTGHGHQSFVLETSSRTTVLLTIARRREPLGTMRSWRRVLELAAAHHVPAPRLLHPCGAEGLERLFGLAHWKRTGQSARLADDEGRLRRWPAYG